MEIKKKIGWKILILIIVCLLSYLIVSADSSNKIVLNNTLKNLNNKEPPTCC